MRQRDTRDTTTPSFSWAKSILFDRYEVRLLVARVNVCKLGFLSNLFDSIEFLQSGPRFQESCYSVHMCTHIGFWALLGGILLLIVMYRTSHSEVLCYHQQSVGTLRIISRDGDLFFALSFCEQCPIVFQNNHGKWAVQRIGHHQRFHFPQHRSWRSCTKTGQAALAERSPCFTSYDHLTTSL